MTTIPNLHIPTPTQSTDPKLYAQLQLLLKIGCNKDVVAGMLELAQFSMHHVRWLAAPLLIHQSPWSDTLPNWLPKAVYQDRLRQICTEHEQGEVGHLATPAEVLACMYPATLEAPMSHSWANVYLWVGNEVMTRYERLPEGQKFWDMIGGHPVSFDSIKDNFTDIAQDIRKRCVEEGKCRGWGSKRRKAKPAPTEEESSVVQINLFDL